MRCFQEVRCHEPDDVIDFDLMCAPGSERRRAAATLAGACQSERAGEPPRAGFRLAIHANRCRTSRATHIGWVTSADCLAMQSDCPSKRISLLCKCLRADSIRRWPPACASWGRRSKQSRWTLRRDVVIEPADPASKQHWDSLPEEVHRAVTYLVHGRWLRVLCCTSL